MLGDVAEIAREFLDDLPSRPVHARADLEQLRSRLGRPLPVEGEDPRTVISELARDADPGVVASAGPRYFGFVVGGALPAAVAADWLTSIWDQNAAGYDVAPAVSVAEEVAAGWVRELLGLPQSCGIGFVTGCQMAHFTCLAAARHAVLREVGWDVEAQGLHRAPEVRVLASEAAHVTVTVACRMLGLGADRIGWIPTDEQGRMRPAALDDALGSRIRADDRLRAGRGRQHRRVRPDRRGRRAEPQARRVVPSRWSVRSVGRGEPITTAAADRVRAGALVGHRRPQVAERALRLRNRRRGRRIRPAGCNDLQFRLHSHPCGRRSVGPGLGAGVLASRARSLGLCGITLARS